MIQEFLEIVFLDSHLFSFTLRWEAWNIWMELRTPIVIETCNTFGAKGLSFVDCKVLQLIVSAVHIILKTITVAPQHGSVAIPLSFNWWSERDRHPFLEEDKAGSLFVSSAGLSCSSAFEQKHSSLPLVTLLLPCPLWICVCFFMCTVYTIWRVCLNVFSLIKLHLSL